MEGTNEFKPGMNADIVARELEREYAVKRLAERKRGRPPKNPERPSTKLEKLIKRRSRKTARGSPERSPEPSTRSPTFSTRSASLIRS